MNRLGVDFLGFSLKNPIAAASGTFGFGKEYAEFYDINQLGAVCLKGLTLHKKAGNDGVRIWECTGGMLNSIGLENPGVKAFIEEYEETQARIQTVKIVNLGGDSLEEYIEGARLLNQIDIDILELNISCPNVKSGGMLFGVSEDSAYQVTRAVKNITRFPLMVKLSPNVADIAAIAAACEEAGADGLSLINTVQGMAIDIQNRRAAFDNVYAGLSGAAIKPIALRMVHQAAKAVNIPIMGIGGIYSGRDVLEFLMVGASCVQIGTAGFIRPTKLMEILAELKAYCEENDLFLKEIINII